MLRFGRIQSEFQNKHRDEMGENSHALRNNRYLMPTYENDPLLTGFEEEDDEEDTQLSDTEANSRYLSQVMTESLALSDAALTAAAGHHPLAQEIPNAS